MEVLCSNGMNAVVGREVAKICDEIRELYAIEDYVRQPNEENLLEFLYDLSAFLLELECPHELLTCGEISTRFSEESTCLLLLKFLQSELKAARLLTFQKLKSGEITEEKRDLELTPVIDNAIKKIHAQKSTNEYKMLESLRLKVDAKIGDMQRQPIFKATLDDKSIPEIEKLCEFFTRDFNNRLLLLNSRLKVTVESFLWCGRLHTQKDKIRAILADRLAELQKYRSEADIPHLLAASSSLLHIQKASSMERRKNTKSKPHPLATGEAPKDRGGRTSEMNHDGPIAPQVKRGNWDARPRRGSSISTQNVQHLSHEERILQQHVNQGQHQHQQHHRGGRGRGRGRGGRGGGHN